MIIGRMAGFVTLKFREIFAFSQDGTALGLLAHHLLKVFHHE
jgi:hypothetical protein